MINLIYAKQWSHYRLTSTLNNPQLLLTTFPINLFHLNFWCQAMILARISQLDTPQNAVFYLYDQKYHNLLTKLSQSQQMKINFKINLLQHIYQIKTNQTIVRNIQQTIMSASALYSFSHHQFNNIKNKAIQNYLKIQGQFLNQQCLFKLSLYLCNKIQPKRQLKQIDDIILGTFIVQQIVTNPTNIQILKKYIILYKKYNVLTSIIQHILKFKNMTIINLAIELAQNFDQMIEIMRLFQADSQLFYRLFWKITKQKKQIQYKNFVIFMLNYSSVKTIILHQNIYIIIQSPQINNIQIINLIKQQNKQLFSKFKTNPQLTARQCIKSYLKLSNFNIPVNKINDSYSDPLSILGIVKKYWQNNFHNQVINYCIWILLDRRFAKLNITINNNNINLNNPKLQQIKNYCKNLFLTVLHIAITYKLGTFVLLYPIQNYRLQQLFTLQSLPKLLLYCKQLNQINWLTLYINNQLPRIVRLQYGYNIIQKLINCNIGNGNMEQNIMTLFNIIDHDLVNKKNNKFLIKNKVQIMRILGRLAELKYKENAEKLMRAILMINHQI